MKPLYYKQSKAAKQRQAEEYDDLMEQVGRGHRSRFGQREYTNSPPRTRNRYQEEEEELYSYEDAGAYGKQQYDYENQMYELDDDVDMYFGEVERGQSFQYEKQPSRRKSNYLRRGYELEDSDSDCINCPPKRDKHRNIYSTENPSDLLYQEQMMRQKNKYKHNPYRKSSPSFREPQRETFQFDRREQSNVIDSFYMRPDRKYHDGYHQYFQTVEEETEGDSFNRHDVHRVSHFQPSEFEAETEEADQFIQSNQEQRRFPAEFDKRMEKSYPPQDRLKERRRINKPSEKTYGKRIKGQKNQSEYINNQTEGKENYLDYYVKNPVKRLFKKSPGKVSSRRRVGERRPQHQNLNVYLANQPTEHSAFQMNQENDLENLGSENDLSEENEEGEEEEIEEEPLSASRMKNPSLKTEYGVYAAQVGNEDIQVFKSSERKAPRERLISVTDYNDENIPMLALKNSLVKSPDKNQSVVYLPVVIVDDKSQLRDFKRLSSALHPSKPSPIAEKPLETNMPVYVAAENYGDNIFQQQTNAFPDEIRESVIPLQITNIHSPQQSTNQEVRQSSHVVDDKNQNSVISRENQNVDGIDVFKEKESGKSQHAHKDISLGIIQEPITVFLSESRQSTRLRSPSFAKRQSKPQSKNSYPVQKSYINVVPVKKVSSNASNKLKKSGSSSEKLLGKDKSGSLRGSGFYSSIRKQDIHARKERKRHTKLEKQQSGISNSPSDTYTKNIKESITIKQEDGETNTNHSNYTHDHKKQNSKSIFRFPSRENEEKTLKTEKNSASMKKETSRNEAIEQQSNMTQSFTEANEHDITSNNTATVPEIQQIQSETQQPTKTPNPPSLLKKESKSRRIDSVGSRESKTTIENIYIAPPKGKKSTRSEIPHHSSHKSKRHLSPKVSSRKIPPVKSASSGLRDNTESKWGWEESPLVYMFQVMNYFLGLTLYGTLMEALRTF